MLITGDYKFDQTPVDGAPADVSRLAELGREGAAAAVRRLDERRPAGHRRRQRVERRARTSSEVFARCEGRIVVTCFASNIHRVQQVVDAAAALGRKVALVGRSMRKNVNIGRTLGHIDVPEGMLVPPREIEHFPDDKRRDHLDRVAGRAAVGAAPDGPPRPPAGRAARGRHRDLLRHADPRQRARGQRDDRPPLPDRRDVITPRDAPIHASGHGYAEELKLMLNLTQPRYVMPVHGDYKRLRLHGQLAEAVGVAAENIFRGENGLPLEIDAPRRALRRARAGGPDLRRRGRHRRRRGRRPARPPHAVRRRHLHRRRDRLRAGRPSVVAARGDLPRRAVPRRQRRRSSTSSARRSRTRSTAPPSERDHARSTCCRDDAPRRPRGVHLRPPQAAPDGAAGRRRGLREQVPSSDVGARADA